jgi:O-antigen/teichoic acid export membrane protein
MLASKSITRLLGLLRTLVLARLLLPEDFGIIGIAMLTVSFVEMFTETGFSNALIQKKGAVDDYLDTAWTFSIGRSFLLFSVIFLLSPTIAHFFNAPASSSVVRVFAVTMVISASRNPGIIYFVKDLTLSRQFLIDISSFFVNTAVAISAAILYRSVWALVFAGIAGSLTLFVLSYLMYGYRPHLRFDKDKFRELLRYGKWISLSFALYYAISNGPSIMVGRLLGAASLGLYQMAYTIGNMSAAEISNLISAVTFPAYAKMQDDSERLKNAFLRVSGFVMLFTFPLTAGMLLLAPEIFTTVLGPRWMAAMPVARILCFNGLLLAMGSLTAAVFNAMARPDIPAKLQMTQISVLAVLLFPFCRIGGMEGAAVALAISFMVFVFGSFGFVFRLLGCRVMEFVHRGIIPFWGCLVMGLVILLLKHTLHFHTAANLALLVTCGSFAYTLSVWFMNPRILSLR